MAMSDPGFEVRPAEPGDMEAIGKMAADLVRGHHALDPTRFFAFPEPIEPGYQRFLTGESKDPKAIVLCAVDGAGSGGTDPQPAVLGYAYGRLRERDLFAMLDGCGYLHDVYVAEAARRRGVATALVRRLCTELSARGAPRIILHAAALNHPSRAFFASLGFRETMVEMMLEGGRL
jgi:ribosomal protein S18 acetylase RimI-like enzyme